MLTLYQTEWCPACHRVRQLMTELGLTYTLVNVPARREDRTALISVSGQQSVPVLIDGDKVYTDSDDIVTYLTAAHRAPADAFEQAAGGAWRFAGQISLPPRAAVARVKELLEKKGFTVVTEVNGPAISDLLPDDYVLLHVAIPQASAGAVAVDPLAPGAVLLPIAVMPTEDGNSAVAASDPVGQVWLYGVPKLNQTQKPVKQRLAEVFAEL